MSKLGRIHVHTWLYKRLMTQFWQYIQTSAKLGYYITFVNTNLRKMCGLRYFLHFWIRYYNIIANDSINKISIKFIVMLYITLFVP